MNKIDQAARNESIENDNFLRAFGYDFESELNVIRESEKKHALKAFVMMGIIATASAVGLTIEGLKRPEIKEASTATFDVTKITSLRDTASLKENNLAPKF